MKMINTYNLTYFLIGFRAIVSYGIQPNPIPFMRLFYIIKNGEHHQRYMKSQVWLFIFFTNQKMFYYKMKTEENVLAQAIGRIVQEKRKKLGLKQEDLARSLNVHKSRISWIERGLSLPQITTLLLLSHELKVTPTVFLKECFSSVNLDNLKLSELKIETRPNRKISNENQFAKALNKETIDYENNHPFDFQKNTIVMMQ